MGTFLSAGLLTCMIIPGLLIVWDRVLDHMESGTGEEKSRQRGISPLVFG